MKKKMMSTFTIMGLMLMLSMPSPAFEPHPEIQEALEALHKAKAHLVRAMTSMAIASMRSVPSMKPLASWKFACNIDKKCRLVLRLRSVPFDVQRDAALTPPFGSGARVSADEVCRISMGSGRFL
jgi:hypothetical protein